MNGQLRILPATSPGPTRAHLRERIRRQVRSDRLAALAVEASAHATSTRASDGHRVWQMSAGSVAAHGHVAILEFLPRNLHVHRGDRVVWTVPGAAEVHTVTFPGELNSDLLPLCENPDGTDSPADTQPHSTAGPG